MHLRRSLSISLKHVAMLEPYWILIASRVFDFNRSSSPTLYHFEYAGNNPRNISAKSSGPSSSLESVYVYRRYHNQC